ncbi:MAG: hypothetical protein MUD16_08110 [Desulfobacterales bacterium]|jgi:hypothetical protein|nr:hypothetical protein [Desulfobacterales bacterium]
MSEQLDLFQPPELPQASNEEVSVLDGATGALDELFRLSPRWRSCREFLDLLHFIARFPNYSPFNGFLIFLQRPDATRVATGRAWLQKHRRRLRPGAHPILILAPMAPVLFVFDQKDTEGEPLAEGPVPAEKSRGRLRSKVLEHTLHNCSVQRIAVREKTAVEPAAERAIRLTPAVRKAYADMNLGSGQRHLILVASGLSPEEKFAALALELGHVFCGHLGDDSDAWWPDRRDLELEQMAVEAAAAAFLVCCRKGLERFSPQPCAAPADEIRELPAISLQAVFQAAGHIEEMGKQPWRRPHLRGRR